MIGKMCQVCDAMLDGGQTEAVTWRVVFADNLTTATRCQAPSARLGKLGLLWRMVGPAPVFILNLNLPSTSFSSRLSQVDGSSVYTSKPSLDSVRNSKLRLEFVPPSHFLNWA